MESEAKPRLPPPPPKPDARLVVRRAPDDLAAEQLRVLAARVECIALAGRPRIGITSADPGEGRSTVAANLALAIGPRQRVLLCEADLRRPSLHQLFGLSPVLGLVDLVAGRATVEQATLRLDSGPFDLLPAGVTASPHAVIGGPRMRQLLDEAATRHALILVDLPPILGTADVLTLAPALDGVLLVARAGRSIRERVRRAAALLPPALLVGAVLVGG